MSAVADDLAQTIAGIRLALQAANSTALVPNLPVQPRWPDQSWTASSESERAIARQREEDELQLERDIERLWQEKQRLERDIAQTAQRHRLQTGRVDDDGVGGAGEEGGADVPVRASAPRATRTARPPDRPPIAPNRGGEKAGGDHGVFLPGLGNSVAREIPTAAYRRNDLPATSPGWEEDADSHFFLNAQENETKQQRHRPFLRAAPPVTQENLDPSTVDMNNVDINVPPAPVLLQRPQRSHGAPDSVQGNNEWPDQPSNMERAKKGIWQLVPDYDLDAREAGFSDYSDYVVSGGRASDPVNNSHEAEMVYSDYGGTYSLQDLKIPQQRPKQVQLMKDHLVLQSLQDDTRNCDRVYPPESSTPVNPKAPTLLQRPDDKSQEGQQELVKGQRRALRAAFAPSLAADAFNGEFSDCLQPIHRPSSGVTATYSQSIKAPASSDTTTFSPATCESLFSAVISDDVPVVDQTGATFHHGTITVHAHSQDHPQHLEQPVGIFRTEETDEVAITISALERVNSDLCDHDLAGEGDRLAMEVQRRMVEAATRKMNDTSTTNAPDAPPSKLRSSGRFSIQPTLPPVEESMEEDDEEERIESLRHRLESIERAVYLEQEEEYLSWAKVLAPVKDPHEDLIEQYLHLSPATVTLHAHQPPSPIAREAVQTVAAAPKVQRAAAPPAPSNLAQIERDEAPFLTGSELPARPAGIPAHYVPAPFQEPHDAHQMPGQIPMKPKNAGLPCQRLVATEALDSPHHAPPPRIADFFGDNATVQPPSDSVIKDQHHAAKGSIAHPDSTSMSDEQRHGVGGSQKQLFSAKARENQILGSSPGANKSNPEMLTSSPSSCVSELGSVKKLPSNCVSQIVSVTAAEGVGQALASSSETLPYLSPRAAPLHQLQSPLQDFSSLKANNGDSPMSSILTHEDRHRLGGSLGPATVAYFPPPPAGAKGRQDDIALINMDDEVFNGGVVNNRKRTAVDKARQDDVALINMNDEVFDGGLVKRFKVEVEIAPKVQRSAAPPQAQRFSIIAPDPTSTDPLAHEAATPTRWVSSPDDVECLASPLQAQPAKAAPQDSPTAPAKSQPMSKPPNSALSWQITANQVVVESDSDDEITVSGDKRTVVPSSNLPVLPGLFNQLPATSSHALEPRSNAQTRSKGVEDYEEAGAPLHPTMLDEEITDDLFLQAMCFNNGNTNGEPPSDFVEGGPSNKKRMPAFTTTAKHSPGPVGVSDVIGNLFGIGAAQSSGAGRVQSASHVVLESVLL